MRGKFGSVEDVVNTAPVGQARGLPAASQAAKVAAAGRGPAPQPASRVFIAIGDLPRNTGKRIRAGSVSDRFSGMLLLALLPWTIPASAQPAQWHSLFDGKSLEGWRETPFTGHGRVRVENGVIVLGPGKPLTGITWTGSVPKQGYEVRFEASRFAGADFFASLTFPAGDSFCTWVLGGWGGDIVGLSNLDGWDASDNETRSYFDFEKGRWYAMRLRVTGERIRAWIDDRPIIDVAIEGRSLGLRYGEIRLSAPFGFSSYATTGAVRNIRCRLL